MANHHRPSGRESFEVAIICAVNVEVSAVESLFEEDWESERSYGKAHGDTNSYKIGRIANCNVVLAYLPEIGNNSAAKTAIWLKTSFPNISLALLVGICGGVPSSDEGDEILLGDVVISTGIVQYDLGRLYPNAFSSRNGAESLPKPQPRIRSLLAKLQAGETRTRLQANTYQNLLDLRCVHRVTFPGLAEDRLYAPSYRHKHQRTQDCEICARCSGENDDVCETSLNTSCYKLGCSNDHLEPRDRLEMADLDEDELPKPKVHFGKMASGNFVVKSSLHRNKIAASEGIIAFEMEGVAVWEELPTVIVKSVCDYADSHKNKDWQGYAACIAAACSKAIISEYRAPSEAVSFQNTVQGPNEFVIPPANRHAAMKVKEGGKPSLWSYGMYFDGSGNPVKVEYSTSLVTSEELAQTLVNEPILGFGMHWLEPGRSIVPTGETAIGLYEKHNISLIVLAKEDCICIFQLTAHDGNSTDEKIAPTLRKILESSSTLKAGVLIFRSKDRRLSARFGIQLKGIFELDDLHNILDHKEDLTPRRALDRHYIPINDLVEEHMDLDLYRSRHLHLSNWSRCPLYQEQISYAANDAYAGYQLYRVMNAKRERMRPVPQLPLPAEQQSEQEIQAKEIHQSSITKRKRVLNVSPERPFLSSQSSTGFGDPPEAPSPPRKIKSPPQVHESQWIDPHGKLVWRNGKPSLNFGKFVYSTLQEIAADERWYLVYMADPQTKFSPQVIKIAKDALDGIFPTPPTQNLPIRIVVD